jgi:hypothetical protein
MYPVALNQEAYDEQEAERTGQPTTTADLHRDWHHAVGVPIGAGACPWDACDPAFAEERPPRGAGYAKRLLVLATAGDDVGLLRWIPWGDERTARDRTLLKAANAVWQARLLADRVRRGLTVGVWRLGRPATPADAQQMLDTAHAQLAAALAEQAAEDGPTF